MVCPNCHSKEIISVQGQNFCISCGQLVPEGSPSPAAAPEAKPTKRPVGRPRKARLDTPITHLPPAETPQAPPSGPPEAAAVKISLPKSPAIAPTKPKAMTDVRPVAQATAQSDSTPNAIAQPRAVSQHQPAGIIGAAFNALLHPNNYAQALPAALAVLLPLALIWSNVSRLAGGAGRLRLPEQWGPVLQLGLSGLIVATLALIGIGAIIYGTARRHDKRGKSGSGLVWAQLSAGSVGRLWGVVLWQLLIIIPTIIVLAAIIRYGSLDLTLPPLVGLAAVFLVAVTAGYLLLGAVVAGLLGIGAVMLGDVGVWRAVSLGWHGYRKHFELVAGLVFIRLVWIGLAAAWVISLWPVTAASLTDPWWLVKAGTGAVILVMISLVTIGGAAEAAYRHAVSMDRFGQAGTLLMGRTAKSSPKLPAFPLLLATFCALGIVAVQLTILR